ncbi:MAG: hypothetical protein AB7O45_04960, partial [Alphaproteobacteria bacterium]
MPAEGAGARPAEARRRVDRHLPDHRDVLVMAPAALVIADQGGIAPRLDQAGDPGRPGDRDAVAGLVGIVGIAEARRRDVGGEALEAILGDVGRCPVLV